MITGVALLAASAALAGGPAAPAPPSGRCACHDALAPRGAAPTVDLRGWLADGLHRQLGCEACHPGATTVPHHPDRVRRVGCETCHRKEAQGWTATVHGRLEGQDPRIQGCQTCHAEHPFFRDTTSLHRFTNTGLLYGCAHCHQPMPLDPSLVLAPKPAPPGKPWPSSVHGLMADGDRRFVAACDSCHGSHQIFPAADPRSAVYPTNLAGKCGECHPGFEPTSVAGRICRVRGGVHRALTNYFDIWYVWGSGVVALWLAGVGGALGVGALLKSRRKTETSDRGRDASIT